MPSSITTIFEPVWAAGWISCARAAARSIPSEPLTDRLVPDRAERTWTWASLVIESPITVTF
jgi:hypothetical protein